MVLRKYKILHLPEGTRVVTSSGANGYKASGYLITYENGVQVNKELISTDVYSTRNQVVSVGTKKVEAPAAPTPEETTPTEILLKKLQQLKDI